MCLQLQRAKHVLGATIAALALLFGYSPSASASPIAPFLNNAFPERLPTPAGLSQRNYFPDVSFVEPLRIIEHPLKEELMILSKDGKGFLITNEEGATDKRLFMDIQPLMAGNPEGGEGGISDLAFHPQFGQAGHTGEHTVFISYWWSPDNSGTFNISDDIDGYNRVSRFQVANDQVDLQSEEVLINQYDREYWHLGMNMVFGPDGFLYIGMGDETPTTCCDRADSTQQLDGGLWGGILRIDIDNDPTKSHPIRRQPRHPTVDPTNKGPQWPASSSQGYSIPNDNPFQATDGSLLEEFYSIGLRHPWTISIDQQTGDLWAADVGRFKREEINRIAKGDNHGWPFREGSIKGPDRAPNTILGTLKEPVWDYDHSVGKAVIGAGMYRGSRYPQLTDTYVFSDFVRGQLWSAIAQDEGYRIEQVGTIEAGFNNGTSGYLLDRKGSILMTRSNGAQRNGGSIDLLVQDFNSPSERELPPTLAATGAFNDIAQQRAIAGCIDYELNAPFWSDGALKYRWMCLPNNGTHSSADEQIGFSEEGPWSFPLGTVLIKHFDVETHQGDPDSAAPIETRFIVIGTEGPYGVTYQWNNEGTQATLVKPDGDTRPFIQTQNGQEVQRLWQYPSHADCETCHLSPAGPALGINSRQLNRNHTYTADALTKNQLLHLDALNVFANNPDIDNAVPVLTTLVDPHDTSAILDERARSYLDANCGYCHQPGGVRALFDARYNAPAGSQGPVNADLLEDYSIANAAVIVPGSPARSIAHVRASALDELAMPPVGKGVIDDRGMSLLQEWILDLGQDGNDSECDVNDPQNQRVLLPNQWAQLSLPCILPVGATLASTFGDDIPGVYGTNWVVYVWDPSRSANYIRLEPTDTLRPGQGFWIVQSGQDPHTLQLPDNSRSISADIAFGNQCIHADGCSSVPLTAIEQTTGVWNLIGNPLSSEHTVSVDQLRVITKHGICAAGCSLEDAAAHSVAYHELFHLDNDVYVRFSGNGVLSAFDGYWLFGDVGTSRNDAALLFPTQ